MAIANCSHLVDQQTFNYKKDGEDWGDTVADAEMCRIGTEQSPIDINSTSRDIKLSDKMELNGYGYVDFKLL